LLSKTFGVKSKKEPVSNCYPVLFKQYAPVFKFPNPVHTLTPPIVCAPYKATVSLREYPYYSKTLLFAALSQFADDGEFLKKPV